MTNRKSQDKTFLDSLAIVTQPAPENRRHSTAFGLPESGNRYSRTWPKAELLKYIPDAAALEAVADTAAGGGESAVVGGVGGAGLG